LVNAHDHLEFSLFPRLGQGPFPSAREWARAVYRPNEPPIWNQLQLSKRNRLIWGGLKNLLSGVTTVGHHNPYDPAVFGDGFPVRVVSRFGWAHSLDFSDDVAARFAATPATEPFLIHLGEATDAAGRQQIFDLHAMGALDRRTVLVHAVALDENGLALAEQRAAAVVWCPSSNLFTLGKTLEKPLFARNIKVALATDSALTGAGDLLDELRIARRLDRVSPARLYEMVTTEAAEILRLNQGEGRLAQGGIADLVVIADPGGSPCDALTADEPPQVLMVMVAGEIKLVAESFADRIAPRYIRGLSPIQVAGREPCRVAADVAALTASARQAFGPDEPIRLAGKALTEFPG
jgi:cytosine/adenosine deaminase-related metal-dependent hydrolase